MLLQDLKLTKHWFSSFQDVILAEGMNEICATLRPPMTIFLMAGASTSRAICIFLLFVSVFFSSLNYVRYYRCVPGTT